MAKLLACTLAAALVAGARAIYPDDHWQYATKLNNGIVDGAWALPFQPPLSRGSFGAGASRAQPTPRHPPPPPPPPPPPLSALATLTHPIPPARFPIPTPSLQISSRRTSTPAKPYSYGGSHRPDEADDASRHPAGTLLSRSLAVTQTSFLAMSTSQRTKSAQSMASPKTQGQAVGRRSATSTRKRGTAAPSMHRRRASAFAKR